MLEQFIARDLWDEARVIVGHKKFGQGLAAPEIPGHVIQQESILNDKVLFYRNSRREKIQTG